MKRFELSFGLLKIPTDFLMTIAAFYAAYRLRLVTEPIEGIAKPIDFSTLPTLHEYINFSTNAAIALIIIFAIGKMYSFKSTSRFSQETQKALMLCGLWVMAIITYFFFTRTFPFSRLAIFYSWALTYIFIILGRSIIRIIQRIFLHAGIGKRRLIFIGNNNLTLEISKKLSQDPSFKIIGLINQTSKNSTLKFLGNFSEVEKILKKYRADEVIQTKSDLSETQNSKILEYCELNHINYRFIPDLLDVRRTNINIETISGIPIISIKPTPLDGWGKITKRILDTSGAGLGLVLLSPIFLITAIAIKFDSKGPIFFSKLDDGSPARRIGKEGKPFKFYKFRSMHPNTDKLRYTALAKQNTRTDGPLIKIKQDPRVTRVGRFLRQYSIDELPQLWSVLIGDMSLVGPRPHLPEEVANYQKHHHFVLTIKPGLSGLSQISGRSDLSFEEEVKLDRYYIENWSILLDLKIIFRTILVVLRGHKE